MGCVFEVIRRQEQYQDGPFCFPYGGTKTEGSLDATIKALQEIREQIPEEFRSSASAEVTVEDDYDGGWRIFAEIGYNRPKTESEMAEYLARQQAKRVESEKKDWEAFCRLSKKFSQPF